jgi:hypothetical protein
MFLNSEEDESVCVTRSMGFYQHFLYATDPSQRCQPNGASQDNRYHVPLMIIPPRNKRDTMLQFRTDKEDNKVYGTNMRHYVNEKSKSRAATFISYVSAKLINGKKKKTPQKI